jgi:hypothetical protein
MDTTQRDLRVALGVLACALTTLTYLWALDHPFVFDDGATVLLNPALVDAWNVRAVLLHDPPRAIVNLSYAVDRGFWGFSSFGFHITNFVLHVIVVGLFYGFCTRALADASQPPSPRGRNHAVETRDVEWPAFFAAATFGLHPLMGAAAEYVSARSELLCAIGVLAALIWARRAIRASSVASGVLATVSGAFAIGSSVAAAVLPLGVLAYDRWVLRGPGSQGRLWRVYLPGTAAAGLIAAWHARAALSAVRVPPRGVAGNMMTAAVVLLRYAGMALVPVGQSLVHQVHWVTSPADPVGLLALAALGAALGSAWHARHAAPLAALGAMWFLAALAPTSTLVPLRDAMAESRTYVAGLGLWLAGASLLAHALQTRRAARIAGACVLALLAIGTERRHAVWADPLRLWEESVRRSPDAWQAHLGYADLLRETGQCARARPEYEAALRLNSGDGTARQGLELCRKWHAPL